MSTSLRRRTAMVALALSILGGGAALMANRALYSPTADGGMPVIGGPGGGPITLPPITRPPITRPPITIEPPTTLTLK